MLQKSYNEKEEHYNKAYKEILEEEDKIDQAQGFMYENAPWYIVLYRGELVILIEITP